MSSSAQTNHLAPGVDAAIPPDLVCRLSVEQFHRMVREGIVAEDDPLELLDGWLVPKMRKNPEHGVVTELLRRALEQILPSGWHIKSQEPVTLSTSEPEPDVMVLHGQLLDYLHGHPKPGDVALVVEVADTSLEARPDHQKATLRPGRYSSLLDCERGGEAARGVRGPLGSLAAA